MNKEQVKRVKSKKKWICKCIWNDVNDYDLKMCQVCRMKGPLYNESEIRIRLLSRYR